MSTLSEIGWQIIRQIAESGTIEDVELQEKKWRSISNILAKHPFLVDDYTHYKSSFTTSDKKITTADVFDGLDFAYRAVCYIYADELADAEDSVLSDFIHSKQATTKQIRTFLDHQYGGCFVDNRDLAYSFRDHIKTGSLLAWKDPHRNNGAMLVCPLSLLLLIRGIEDPRTKGRK